MSLSPMPHLELISHRLCPYVQRAVITLLEKQIAYTRTDIDLANKPDWFLQISPLGKVPLLKISDETRNEVLFESAVICEYLDEITPGSLHPADPLERAKHRAWIEFGSGILGTIASLYTAPDAATFEQMLQGICDKFARLEEAGIGHPYFSGESFSLVDAVYGPIFRYFDVLEVGWAHRISVDVFAQVPYVQRWRQSLHQRSSVHQAVANDYPQHLRLFLEQRRSYLSEILVSAPPAQLNNQLNR